MGRQCYFRNCSTVEPRLTDTRLIRTPAYNGQFCRSRRKAHTFALTFTRLIRTPVNTDNGHFFLTRLTVLHTKLTSLYGHFIRYYSNSVLLENESRAFFMLIMKLILLLYHIQCSVTCYCS